MAALIVNNLVRRSGRTLLTALGVGLGVATIVALLSISSGLTKSAVGFAHLGNSDFAIFQSGAVDPGASVLPISMVAKVQRNPDVASATPLLLIVGKVKGDASAIAFGADPSGFFAHRLVFSQGTPASLSTIAVGDGLADSLHAHTGSTVTVAGHRFHVSGIYHSGIPYEDQGAMLVLATAQAITGEDDEITSVPVVLKATVSSSAAEQSIEREFPNTYAITNANEAARAGVNGQLIHDATLVIVILALLIGAISVTNTMAMSVLERQAELAVLSTIGWSGAPGRLVGDRRGNGRQHSGRGDRSRARRPGKPAACGDHGRWRVRHAVDHRMGAGPRTARRRPDRRARRPLPGLAGYPHGAVARPGAGELKPAHPSPSGDGLSVLGGARAALPGNPYRVAEPVARHLLRRAS